MQVVLVMFRPDGQRRSFSVTRDMTVIGRREDCDLRIPLGDVSRKHCRVIKDDAGIRVEDLGSSNGTYRNGERIQSTDLAPGDTVQVGPVVFVLQVDGQPADDALQPVIAGTGDPDGTVAAAAPPAAGGAGDAEMDLIGDPMGDGDAATEFDPMEALAGDPEASGFEFQIDDTGLGQPAAGDEAPLDLESEEHDQKA